MVKLMDMSTNQLSHTVRVILPTLTLTLGFIRPKIPQAERGQEQQHLDSIFKGLRLASFF